MRMDCLLSCAMFVGAMVSCEAQPVDVDCAWLEGDNCFRQFMGAAQSIFHEPPPTGTFNAGVSECSYEDGILVTLSRPLDLAAASLGKFGFEIHGAGDDRWFSLADQSSSVQLEGPEGTLVWEKDGSLTDPKTSLVLTCPDHNRYRIGITACGDATPLFTMAWSDTTLSYSVMGAGTPEQPGRTIFSCSK